MRVCILGSGLTALTLAKALVNQNIFVDLVSSNTNDKINHSSIQNHPWVEEPNLNDLTNLESWVKNHVNDF